MKEIEGIIERKRSIEEVKLMKPLVWAYIGDCIYEIFIRMKLVNSTNLDPHRLHIETIRHVKAKAQAETLEKIQAEIVKKLELTEEEKDIVRRGRNAEAHHQPKNADLADYKHATAFEALIGYLYLSKQDERLKEILEISI